VVHQLERAHWANPRRRRRRRMRRQWWWWQSGVMTLLDHFL